jgi:hypothetical protein
MKACFALLRLYCCVVRVVLAGVLADTRGRTGTSRGATGLDWDRQNEVIGAVPPSGLDFWGILARNMSLFASATGNLGFLVCAGVADTEI